MKLAVDTETNGVDLYHQAEPFLVTFCDENQVNEWYEWDVNPKTRKVNHNKKDIDEIEDRIMAAEELYLQNSVFDVTALSKLRKRIASNWPWNKTFDTLVAGHLLASNQPHDLTTMTLIYCGVNVQPFEDNVKDAVNQARRLVKVTEELQDWRIAKPGMDGFPSIRTETKSKTARGTESESPWKNDMWLLRAFIKLASKYLPETDEWSRGDNPESHPWAVLCENYANVDTSSTIALHQAQLKLLTEQKLDHIYYERLKLLPVCYKVQRNGITLNSKRLTELEDDYTQQVAEASDNMLRIAKAHKYDLTLPKGSSNNKSLMTFCFGEKDEDGNPVRPLLNLPVVQTSKKTGSPSLDKTAMAVYEIQFDDNTDQGQFINSLKTRRKKGKSLEYAASYRKFWKPLNPAIKEYDWYRLHPSMNPTGTDTLRWSGHNPSPQVISKQKDDKGRNLRYAFGPGPGREWWSLDYDNLELRLPAYECGEPAMLELFENPDKAPYFGSYHLLIFSILHPDKYDHDDPDGLLKARDKYADTWYQWTKNGNFAELYGAVDLPGGRGTADIAYHVNGAQSIIAKKLVEKSRLNKYWIEYANKHGYVETMPDKELGGRGYPLWCQRTHRGRVKETIPLNYHVQGTACWVMFRAMIKIQEYFDELNRTRGKEDFLMVMNVHDEVVLDLPFKKNMGNLPKVRRVQTFLEERGDNIGVPLTAGIKYNQTTWHQGVAV